MDRLCWLLTTNQSVNERTGDHDENAADQNEVSGHCFSPSSRALALLLIECTRWRTFEVEEERWPFFEVGSLFCWM
jgi:hypothetical protein